ncbi:fibronectin type III domain-containing protein [Catellatospora methionotrophica]|uniref:fibronectin type III domain-containing protein n=1 Tax=Catellatospora methionotrophica TaxID=121620 RepID=UPI0014075641|nr:fibronectin type III domain-containing protein [Catellatospora methionotrophica]
MPRYRQVRPRGLSRVLAALCIALLGAAFVQVAGQTAAGAVTLRARQGIQAGDVINLDAGCAYTDSGNLLLADTEVQQRSGWLRLDLRGAADTGGCARGAYANLLGALDPDMKVIGLLSSSFASAAVPADFAAHAAAIACDGAYAGVDAWEVWNEPNLPGGSYLSEVVFAELLARTSDKIHQCGGDAKKVVSGGVTPNDPIGYLQQVSTEIGAHPEWTDHFDYANLRATINGIGLHPYVKAIDSTTYTGDTGTHQPLWNMVWQFTSNSALEFAGEPVYLTEFGWRLPDDDGVPNHGEETTEAEQCFNLVSAFDHIAGMPNVVAGTWFTLKDFGDTGRRFGLYDVNGGVRLARSGYVNDHCNGATDGAYNTDAEQLQWRDAVALAAAGGRRTDSGMTQAAAATYEVVLAPSDSPSYTMTRSTGSLALPLSSFYPPLPVGTYIWRVNKIVNGLRYPGKDQWKFTFQGKPAPPSGATATPAADGASIKIGWVDGSNTEDGFAVTDGATTANAPANATTHTWTGLAPGSTHCYRVRAFNAYGASAEIGPVCATTPSLPAAPSGVTATVVTGTSVRVDWADNSGNETAFDVSDGTSTVAVAAGSISYTWAGLANGATRCFQVRSRNLVGHSPWAGNACATTPTIPAVPTSPTAAAPTGTSIKVNWADQSANEWGFEVSNGTTSQVVGANTTTFTWGGLANGTYMCFRVRSYNLAGYSAWTAYACATTPTIPVAPASPTAVVASGTSIRVGWADQSTNEIGFEISNGVTSQVVGANSTAYTWGGLANGTYMCFRVRSYSLAGYSAWTAYACATTPTIPAVPTSPYAAALSTSQISVSWQDRSTNETSFQVYNGVSTITVGANVTSYTWGGLAAGTYMCFAVRAVNLAGASAWTPYACATTPAPPAGPTGQAAAPLNTSQIRVTWQDRSTNETGFQIYNGVSTVTVGANATGYIWGGLASRTYMCFAIRSYNAYGYSAWTPYACTTTL